MGICAMNSIIPFICLSFFGLLPLPEFTLPFPLSVLFHLGLLLPLLFEEVLLYGGTLEPFAKGFDFGLFDA